MITREEIEQKAIQFEIHPSNVERDYIFGWMLFGLFTISAIKDEIFLKGGNALRKGYFQNTRFSSDLDLGIPGDIQQSILLEEINKVCDFVQKESGVVFNTTDNKLSEKFTAAEAPIPDLKVYEARIYFRDFYGNSDHIVLKVTMDITRFDKVILPIKNVKLIHPYSDSAKVDCEIRCMKLEEIIATKLKCLLQRQHAPDLYDYVYSVKLLGGNLDANEVITTFIQKTIFRRNPHVLKDILINVPFEYFRMYWTKTIVCAKQHSIEVDEAIRVFIENLEMLFGIYPDNGFGDFAYFGHQLRNPIMQAGRDQTLLKINYGGSVRMVEPYSLKYLQRKDGYEREYFFVYNLSGGSGVGVRCFVANKIESIENTDQKYSPRFQIELCKAGERPDDPYCFDPNRPVPAPKIRVFSSRVTSRVRYIYQCSYCSKKFEKTTQSGVMRSHKNKYGYPCAGRHGYYVGMKY